jgi:pilus assembly protein Flp/PilA
LAPHDAVQSSGEEIMSNLVNYVKTLANQEEGQDLLEYALLVALIALVAVLAVTQAGQAVATIFGNIAAAIGGAA